MGTKMVQGIHDKTGYILNTTKEERKAVRKAARAKKREEGRGFRNSLSQWRPLGFLARRRDLKKERQDDLGVSNPIPE